MTVFLDGIAAQFYRGIGDEVQYITPFARMNFFIGANNAGKSIVLNLLAGRLAQALSGKATALAGPEVYRGRVTGDFLLAVGRSAGAIHEELLKEQGGKPFHAQYGYAGAPPTFASETKKILDRLAISGCVWATIGRRQEGARVHPELDVEAAEGWTREWYQVCTMLTGRSGGSQTRYWISATFQLLARKAVPTLPPIHLIPAKRVLGGRDEAFDDLTGKGLIDHLAGLQNPNYDRREDEEKFARINRFLQEVVGKAAARLEVPHNREHLLVHIDNKVLPLSALGTGIHEVVLIAAFCTIHDGAIMCIEEPEIHLHPLLQRKLVAYLLDHTRSQYFIATHAPAFIDTPGANVFHVENDGEQTRVTPALTRAEQRGILDDLGAQASDILQSNAVIWVEGPSDRIYLNHWIRAVDARLKEGIHYTIMFFGGALISHLTASDTAVEAFIRLRDLNRNMAVLIDSDRDSAGAALKPHAQRLLEELGAGGGQAWVTAGREVENYVDGARLQEVLKQIHPKLYVAAGKTGPYDHAFYFYRDDQKGVTYKEADKVGAALLLCAKDPTEEELEVLDLRERLGELVEMIRKANGLAQGG